MSKKHKNTNKATPTHATVKLLKTSEKEKLLKSNQGKKMRYVQETKIRSAVNFLWKQCKKRVEQHLLKTEVLGFFLNPISQEFYI